MVESTQLILTGVVVLLAFLLVLVGVQVFLILNEFRRALRQFNSLIGDFKVMTDTTTQTLKTVMEKSTSIAGIANLVNLFLLKRKKKDE